MRELLRSVPQPSRAGCPRCAKDPGGRNILPVLLEDVELPLGLKSLLWYDLREPGDDEANVARLAAAIGRSAVVDHGRCRPPERGKLGAFPRAPLHKFQGRARELYQLEQQFRTHRAVLLHAMGGMGKTSLAREAAYWWTRTGLFPDGACFASFEQGASPEQIALVLGTYLDGESFEQLSQDQQCIRARQLFQQKRVLVVWDNFESVLPAFANRLTATQRGAREADRDAPARRGSPDPAETPDRQVSPSDIRPASAAGRPTVSPCGSVGDRPQLPVGSRLNEDSATRQRYVGVYYSVGAAIYNALTGSNPRGGMEVMAREKANFRQAVEWAVADGQDAVAGPMGSTFCDYLERCARFRERDRWVAWLADEAQRTGWTEAGADAEREAAWSQFTQGQPQQAVERMQALIQRLEQTTEFDPAFPLATARQWLGRMCYLAGAANRAVPILEQAVGQWERLAIEPLSPTLSPEYRGEGAGGVQGDVRVEDDPRADRAALGNLSATLGDLANALRRAGRLDEALETAERCIRIQTRLGNDREIAADIGRSAQLLMQQGRYREADQRYEAALAAARRAGDKELEGTGLQHQGLLAVEMQQYDRAIERYKRALRLFQEAGNEGAVMRTCNLLGRVEDNQGRLAEARAWYERSREIALRRQDQESIGSATQNIGIVCQQEGERLREQGQEEAARQQFAEAERFLQESLACWIDSGNEVYETMSQGQLAQLYLLMGRLDRAEEHAGRAREIRERLGDLRGLSITYQTLKRIAQARRDEQAAADWAAKKQAVDRELARRARGGDDQDDAPSGLSERILQLLASVAVTCVQAAANNSPPPPEVAQLLEQLDSSDAGPLQPLIVFLRRLGTTPADQLAQQLAHPPADIPDPFPELFAQLHAAVQDAGLG